ncbi:MAG: FtsX-like permease family protein [Actinomycetota bacterium]
MINRTLKMAWFKRNRYVLTVIAIALSVAFIVSTLLLTTSIADVGEPMRDAHSEVDAVVTGAEVSEADGPTAAIAASVPTSTVDSLNAAGYEAVGFTNAYAQVIDADGNASGQDQSSNNIAEPWLGSSSLNAFEIAEGAAPAAVGEAALDVTTANRAGLAVGDTFTYVTDAGIAEAELVGTATFGGNDNDPYVSTMLLDPSDPTLAPVQGYDLVLVDFADAPGASVDDVATLAAGSEVQSGTDWIEEQIDLINSTLGFFSTFLTVFAVIAVVVGMVIVTNTFTVSLAQRTEELALLRLVGTTRSQLMVQVVLEAALLGAVGTIVGVFAGLGGVNLLGVFLDWLGLTIERSSAIAPSAIAIGVFVGMGVTIAAAVWPARKATAVAPIEALRSAELEPPSAGRNRGIAAVLMLVVAVVGLGYGMTQGSIWWAGAGIGGAFAALYLGAEYLIRIAARVARPVLGTTGPAGTVASRNLERNASRTSAAASALMIGISLIAFFTLMAATVGQLLAGDSATALRADNVVQGIGAFPEAVIGDDVITDLEAVDGVDSVIPIYSTAVAGDVEIERAGPGGGALSTAITDFDEMTAAYDFEVNAGSLDDVSGTSVVIDQITADGLAVTAGDTFTVTSVAGPTQLEVAAVIETSLPGTPQPAIIGDADLASVVGYDEPATTLYILGDADERALSEAVGIPTIDVLTIDEYIDSLSSGLDTILALVYALLAVAVVIALVGIANTVSLAISERVGEIAAIRAAGGSSRQIFWSLVSEFGLLALVGVVSGLGLAWVSATGFFQALSDGQVDYPETSIVSGLLIVVAGLAGGVLASWWPARSASRADILDVLRAE